MQVEVEHQPLPTTAEAVATVDPYTGFPLTNSLILGASHSLAVSGSSATVTLSATCRKVRLTPRGGPVRIEVGMDPLTVEAATGHYLAAGVPVILTVPAESSIAAIQPTGETTATALEVSELDPAPAYGGGGGGA